MRRTLVPVAERRMSLGNGSGWWAAGGGRIFENICDSVECRMGAWGRGGGIK